MHQMRFAVVTAKKGAFVDGHKRQDVVEYRKKVFAKNGSFGLSEFIKCPTDQAKLALPHDL